MTAVTAVENETPVTLEELAETIRYEHNCILEAGESMVLHAIRAGQALISAHKGVPHGEWEQWIKENTKFARRSQVNLYMRIARYKDLVGDAPTIRSAKAILTSADIDSMPRSVPEWHAEAKALRGQGKTLKCIGEYLDKPEGTVWMALNSGKRNEYSKAYSQRRSAEKKALKRQERDLAAKKAGGGISEAYSLCRKLAQTLDTLGRNGTTLEIRAAANAALRDIHRAEESIVSALGLS